MTPGAAREWVFSLEAVGIKLGLAQIRSLLDALGHPERDVRTITVAGTNGKGSVTSMIERGLRAAGLRTGRYTSPHLVSIEERVAIDGQAITPETFDALAAEVRDASFELPYPPSFFEATTAMALLAFQRAGVHTAVLEVGLGGRLDATNAVDAQVAVITPIDLDHQEYLGHTLTAIAAEKAGVIKSGALVCAAPQASEVRDVIDAAARAQHARLLWADAGTQVTATSHRHGSTLRVTTPQASYDDVALALAGRHQVDNAVLAIRVLESLPQAGWPSVSKDAIVTALSHVEWPARLEWRRHRGVDVLIDGAHNPAGARALASFLEEMHLTPLPIVVGIMRDKSVSDVLSALAPCVSAWIPTAVDSPRAMPADELARVCESLTPDAPVLPAPQIGDALTRAADRGGPFVVAGSLYLAGDVRNRILTGKPA